MQFGDDVIDAAVPGNFVVRPGTDGKVNSFAAMSLLKRFFSGPQGLSITDTANEISRRMWESMGAIHPDIYSLDWFRPIKPATAILQMLESARGRPVPFSRPIRAAARAADLAGTPLLGRMARNKHMPFTLEPLDPARLLELLQARDRHNDLRGHYDADSLGWMLEQTRAKAERRALRQAIVLDERGARAGAYIYLLRPNGFAEVLLCVARDGRFDLLLQAVMTDAASLGASVVTGSVNPRQLPAFKNQRAFMMCNQYTLIHSRRPEVLDAFHRGRARLTPLDGERWTRFADLFGI